MKSITFAIISCLFIFISCSNKADFTPEFIEATSGKYLYNPDDIIEVYYENSKMYLKWRNAHKIEPVVLEDNIIFLSDLYKKMHFVKHPKTGERYLSVLPDDDNAEITYDYKKVPNDYKTPSMYLKEKNFEKAAEGFLAIRAQDSLTNLFNERTFNGRGYLYLNEKDYESAIGIFKMNVTLFPDSDNVYDSLADAYLRSGDSLKAYSNYSKAFELNPRNERAAEYIDTYKSKLEE